MPKFAAREQLMLQFPTDELLQSHLIRLLRCVDTMLWGVASERSTETTASAFSHCARIYRRELRRRRDAQDVMDRSLHEQWEVYVGILEHAIAQPDFHDRAVAELIDSLEDVGADRSVAVVREHVAAHPREPFPKDLRQQFVAALLLTSALRSAREDIKRQHHEAGPQSTVLRDLAEI